MDRAVSDAVAASYAAQRAGAKGNSRVLGIIEKTSVRILIDRGCNEAEDRDKVRRRLHRLEAEDLLPAAFGVHALTM